MLDKDDFAFLGEAIQITGLSANTIRRKSADPDDDFPRPIANLSERRNPWSRRELIRWVESRLRSDAKSPRAA